MKVLGLTGGIGTGKSTASSFLEELGWQVIDTDILAREVVAPGAPAFTEVVSTFGPDVVAADGALDRKRLADLVFPDPDRRRLLEEIVHPRIRERWQSMLEVGRSQRRFGAVVVIPLLYETNAQGAFHKVLCTACKGSTQMERLRARGWSESQIQQRLAAQWPLARKMVASDFVIWTEGDLPLQSEQLRRVLRGLYGQERAV